MRGFLAGGLICGWVVLSQLVWAGGALAQGLVPQGRCAVIVAARPTLPEVQEFQREYAHLRFGPVYQAANGVYAVSLGLLSPVEARGWLDERIRAGAIPGDSYCTTGRGLRRVVALPDDPAATTGTAGTTIEADAFRPDQLRRDELRFLQSRLALAGHYAGLLDGAWGPLSQRALVAAAGGRAPRLQDAAAVVLTTDSVIARGGWRQERFPEFGRAMLLPMHDMQSERDAEGRVTLSSAGGPGIILSRAGRDDTDALHLSIEGRHRGEEPVYVLRRPAMWITAVEDDGLDIYLRSDRLASGEWSSVAVIGAAESGAMRLVVSGIGPLDTTMPQLPAGGRLARAVEAARTSPVPPVAAAPPQITPQTTPRTTPEIEPETAQPRPRPSAPADAEPAEADSAEAAVAIPAETGPIETGPIETGPIETAPTEIAPIAAAPAEPAPAEPAPAEAAAPALPPVIAPPDLAPFASGTGFFVSEAGHLLTSAHVVEGCDRLETEGEALQPVAVEPVWDLALVQMQRLPEGRRPLLFSETRVGLNADVTIAGYPMQDLLSGLNVTRGNVSNLTGFRGDRTMMQITAPVQQGNSGGPVVNRRGQVVGVVLGRLNPELGAQNANFAVHGPLARLFLIAQLPDLAPAAAGETLDSEEIGSLLESATVMIVCSR